MSFSTFLSGGCVRDSLYIVKMYWLDIDVEDRARPVSEYGAAIRPIVHVGMPAIGR